MGHFWDSEEIFFQGDEYFDQLLKDLREATTLVTVEMYMFNRDQLGSKVLEELLLAHRRGVRVELILDGVGSYNFPFEQLQTADVPFKFYNPLPFMHPVFGKLSLWRKVGIFFSRLLRLNRRDHRKIITIDSRILYAGSFNITAESTSQFHRPWREMGLRVSGPNVILAVMHFKRLWNLREYYRFPSDWRRKLVNVAKTTAFRVNHSHFLRRFYSKDLLKKIRSSRQRVWLCTPYFIPPPRLIRALNSAAKRGVDVRLLLSEKTDVSLFEWLGTYYYPHLLSKGVKIYRFTESVLHAKSFVIDDWMTVGSSNLNHRSLLHDLEVDLVIQDQTTKGKIIEYFSATLTTLRPVSYDDLKQWSFVNRVLSRLFFLFRYWF